MGYLRAVWGVTGVLALIGVALVKLTPPALEALSAGMAWYHWVVLAVTAPLLGYFKGYRGFQKGFAPRVAARAKFLVDNCTKPGWGIFAPLFCMGYFHTLKRKMIVTYAMTIGMIGLIVLVRLLPSPWRGIIDAGILLGLSWGFLAILWQAIVAFTDHSFAHSPQLPVDGMA